MPPHRSGPNHRLGPGWWAAVVVQPAGVLHGAVSAAPRSARRTTRNDQPSHHPTCLLISKEEDGRLSRTGHAPAQERAEPSIGAGLVGCGSSSARWCAARCSPHRSGPNHRLGPGWWAVVVVQSAGVLHDATPAAPRSARRTTRNDQPSHHPTCLLVSKEEDGRLSETGHAPAQERAEPSIQTGLVGCGSSSARWCAPRCDPGGTPFCTTNDKKRPTRPPPQEPSRQ